MNGPPVCGTPFASCYNFVYFRFQANFNTLFKMANLLEQIDADIKSAMRSKQAETLSTLRLLKSALKYYQIEKKLDVVSDADAIPVIQKQIKQRQDAMDSYRSAGRDDLFKKEEAEMGVLRGYLPQALSTDELEATVKSVIQEVGATSRAQIGQVMKLAIAKAAGRADGKAINAIAMKLLQ